MGSLVERLVSSVLEVLRGIEFVLSLLSISSALAITGPLDY